jgi:8-oxo-dGTP diphosphatase
MPELQNEKSYYSIEINDFFRSAFSVDCVVFGFDEEKLKVLLIRRGAEPFMGDYAVPGDLVYPDEDLEFAAKRVLRELTTLTNVYLEQVHTFGKVNRHPLGRVITISYYSLIKISDYDVGPANWAKEAMWHEVDNLPNLAFDHREIIDACLSSLRAHVQSKPVGFELLPQKFTLRQLQTLYECLLGTTLDTRNFRKKILAQKDLVELNERQHDVAHRPAKLFSFDTERLSKENEDRERYYV